MGYCFSQLTWYVTEAVFASLFHCVFLTSTLIEQNLLLFFSRYEKLLEKSVKRGEFLEEVSAELHHFSSQAAQAEQWCSKLMERANSSELGRLSPEECQIKMEQLSAERY